MGGILESRALTGIGSAGDWTAKGGHGGRRGRLGTGRRRASHSEWRAAPAAHPSSPFPQRETENREIIGEFPPARFICRRLQAIAVGNFFLRWNREGWGRGFVRGDWGGVRGGSDWAKGCRGLGGSEVPQKGLGAAFMTRARRGLGVS